MKYILYGNGGSGNHGCEAIIRGTQQLINGDCLILARSIEEDKQYDIKAEFFPEKTGDKSKLRFILAYLKLKISGNYFDMDVLDYLPAIKKQRNNAGIALSVGGDNYCYSGEEFYGYLNKAYHKNGFKTVLWGCSIDPEKVKKKKVQKDLQLYNAIVTRESITYDAVCKLNDNTFLAPDPAFFMESEECKLPSIFETHKIIGINASPMIISYEQNQGMAYENYKQLIKYIIDNTEYGIALIPHVVWDTNDDREVLKKLYDDFKHHERIALIEDHKAPQLKYIISKCECFVGARTHATIAAYSTSVPTLVVGYSVKARGIARDLFGNEENYVLPVQSLSNDDQLVKGFKWLHAKKESIRSHLKEFLPEYKQKMEPVVSEITKLECKKL